MIVNYREAYGMFLSNGILFNHESPRRGPTFVTRKITRAVARIKRGMQSTIYLGNLDAKRDWGHARDYVEGMWMMMQHDTPGDFVLATGETHAVREFVECSFAAVDIKVEWSGEAGSVDEIGFEAGNPDNVLVRVDPQYFRPTEVELLIGDPTLAKNTFGCVESQGRVGRFARLLFFAVSFLSRRSHLLSPPSYRRWTPKILFAELCKEMTIADLELVDKGDLMT